MDKRLKKLADDATKAGLFSGEDYRTFPAAMLDLLEWPEQPSLEERISSFLISSGAPLDINNNAEAVWDFLLVEVMSSRMSRVKKVPVQQELSSDVRDALDIVGQQGSFFDSALTFAEKTTIPPTLLTVPLEKPDWDRLDEEIVKADAEFHLRRRLLMTRFNACVKSFLWSEEAKKQETKITGCLFIPSERSSLLLSILTCTDQESYVKKVSSAPPSTRLAKDALTKFQVGRVPDRGGRPFEQAPPPPEMPSWQQRQSDPTGGGRGRGGHHGQNRGRGGGGGHRRVQGGGWNK